MNEIRNKMTELITLNPTNENTFDSLTFTHMTQQERLMSKLNELARAKNTLIGRIIKRPFNNSYAYYVVTEINKDKNKITVRWINYCDGWQDDYFGEGGDFQLNRVQNIIATEDELSTMYID